MVVGRFENNFATIIAEKLCEAKLLHSVSHLICILGTISEHGAERHTSRRGEQVSSSSADVRLTFSVRFFGFRFQVARFLIFRGVERKATR